MPKALLQFDLPDEQPEFDLATKGPDMSLVLHDLNEFLRGKTKYEELSDEQHKLIEEVREKLFELCSDYDVEI